MSGRRFPDYVADFRASGALAVETAALVLDGEPDANFHDTDVTGMGRDGPAFSFAPGGLPSQLPQSQLPPVDRRSIPNMLPRGRHDLGFVFLIAKRSGNAFDHISVGRTESMDVMLPLQRVSKFHAYFRREGEQFSLADAGSTNGTWLGTRRLLVRRPELVNNTDRIRLGPYSFTYLSPSGFVELVKSRARYAG